MMGLCSQDNTNDYQESLTALHKAYHFKETGVEALLSSVSRTFQKGQLSAAAALNRGSRDSKH